MTRTTDYLKVFEGEANENIVITTVDENGAAIDPTFALWGVGESKLELKPSDLSTTTTTLDETDQVSQTSTSVTMKIAKIGSTAAGTYVAFLTLDDGAGRIKILKFHVIVEKLT